VRRCSGPERIQGEWWAVGLDRRYWVLDLEDGRCVWIYAELGNAWLHGFFDQGSGATAAVGVAS
jgi:hypothetical protein